MNEIFQKTIEKPFSFRGVGLHSGKTSSVKVLPAEANSGINFVRVDLEKDNLIDEYINPTPNQPGLKANYSVAMGFDNKIYSKFPCLFSKRSNY